MEEVLAPQSSAEGAVQIYAVKQGSRGSVSRHRYRPSSTADQRSSSRAGNQGNTLISNHGNHGDSAPKKPSGDRRKGDGPATSRSNGRPTLSREPTFYIGGGNGASLVEEVLTELGWRRITDKRSESFKLKWVENNCMINYNVFKEGEQMVNRIPNCNLLTNKLGLLQSLQRHERVQATISPGSEYRLRASHFLPETYRLDDPHERRVFMDTYKEGEIWISKPTGLNQGRGIYLVRDLEELQKSFEETEEKQRRTLRRSQETIIQRYITNPLLLNGRKFDIRAYMLIASTTPYLLLYQRGYVRLSLYNYSNKEDNLVAHLTNQFIQKKDASYDELKEQTVWSMEKFSEYINTEVAPKKGLEQDWVHTTLYPRMKNIVSYCFKAVKHKLKCKLGFFDLYGLDFMIDENMKIWLIEINVNPCLATNCESLKEVVPDIVKETLHVAIECFEKSKRRQPLFPLQSLQNYQILYSGGGRSQQSRTSPPGGATKSAAPRITVRSLSPRPRTPSPTLQRGCASPPKDLSGQRPLRKSLPPKEVTPGQRPLQSVSMPKETRGPQHRTSLPRDTSASSSQEYIRSPSRLSTGTRPRQTLTPRSPTFGSLTGMRGPSKRAQTPEQLDNGVLGASSCENVKFRMSHAALKQKRLLALSQVSSRRELVRSRSAKVETQPQGHCEKEAETSQVVDKVVDKVVEATEARGVQDDGQKEIGRSSSDSAVPVKTYARTVATAPVVKDTLERTGCEETSTLIVTSNNAQTTHAQQKEQSAS